MTIYEFSTLLGAAGLSIMGLSGFAHTAGGHHGAHASHSSHTSHHLSPAHGGIRSGGARAGRLGGRALWALLSPRPLFSILLGFGVVGLLFHSLAPATLLFAVAASGGLLFELGFVRPLWNFLFRFESAAALTLETCVGDQARAASSFDAKGNGLIAIELDGQLVQVLGSLRREDREAGVRIRAGDPVRIDDVDGERNRCTVRPL
jgi:hypothetical protein